MNNFEELQNKWKNQAGLSATDNGFQLLLKRVSEIERKQKIMNMVLLATIVILIAFSVYVSGYKNTVFIVGMSLMIGSLIFRIAFELYSLQKSKKLNYVKDTNAFKNDLTRYYSFRKIVHYLITPLSLLVYVIGFIKLLPLFKESLSSGFYNYILISSVILLVLFASYIYKQIKNELNKLRELHRTD